ncbi:MAG: hypothetical protein E7314_02295 [Clostridiales bacterium]|nr:hypothetical protein [Clostridiales bacterium]
MEKTVQINGFVFEAEDPKNRSLINVNERTAMAKDLMSPEEFGKAFLMDRVLHQNTRDGMSRNSGMDR